jgi:hypothetical protein
MYKTVRKTAAQWKEVIDQFHQQSDPAELFCKKKPIG